MTAALPALLAVALAAPSDAHIERIESPTGGFVRAVEWASALVHVRSDGPFDGAVRIGAYRTPVRIPSGGVGVVRLPFAVPGGRLPGVVLLSDGREVHRKALGDAWRWVRPRDLMVGILPDAAGAPSDLPTVLALNGNRRAFVFPLPPQFLDDSWLLEPVDVIVGTTKVSLGAWRMLGGELWEDARNLKQRLQELDSRRAARVPLVHGGAWELAPSASWPETHRNFVVFFTVLYAFTCFALFSRVSRAGTPAAVTLAVIGLCVFFSLLGVLLHPGGRLSVVAWQFDHRSPEGSGGTLHVVFVTSSTAGKTDLHFPGRVRPVFRDPRGAATAPFVMEFQEGGSTAVRNWQPGAGEMRCFLRVEDARPPDVRMSQDSTPGTPRVKITSSLHLQDASVLAWRKNQHVGEMKAEETRRIEITSDGPPPRGPEFAFLRPGLFRTDLDLYLFARLAVDPDYGSVRSPQLLESRRAGHFLVARFRP